MKPTIATAEERAAERARGLEPLLTLVRDLLDEVGTAPSLPATAARRYLRSVADGRPARYQEARAIAGGLTALRGDGPAAIALRGLLDRTCRGCSTELPGKARECQSCRATWRALDAPTEAAA